MIKLEEIKTDQNYKYWYLPFVENENLFIDVKTADDKLKNQIKMISTKYISYIKDNKYEYAILGNIIVTNIAIDYLMIDFELR